jgi:hypothetical protein
VVAWVTANLAPTSDEGVSGDSPSLRTREEKLGPGSSPGVKKGMLTNRKDTGSRPMPMV